MKDFLKQFFAALRCAFTFKVADDPVIERASRRYYGLALLALGAVLTTWMWTLDSATYASVLDDLLERGIKPADGDLTYARGWALGFYVVDTVLFIGCYVGFSVVIARLLDGLIKVDLATDSSGTPNGVVSWMSRNLVRGTKLLLWLLVIGDGVENVSAMTTLIFGEPVTGLTNAFNTGVAAKGIFGPLLGLWLTGAVMIWLLGGSIPRGDFPALQDARNARRAVRDGIADVLARTRYCMLIVAVYAVLMLGIDQAQDVLSGLAAFFTADMATKATLLGAILLGLFALHTHAHSIWVWVRMLVRLRRSDAAQTAADAPGTIFSKWWGRLLGAAPWFIVAVLCVRTASQGFEVGDTFTGWMLLAAGALASGWGVGFVLFKERESRKPHRKDRAYYAEKDEEHSLLTDDAYRFMWCIKPSPLWIPLIAALGIMVIRALYVFTPTTAACNALAAISFSFALWTCLINRLALNSLRSRIPWVLGLIIVIAVLAKFGATQNHGVLAGENLARTGQGLASLQFMFLFSGLLAAGAAAAYTLWTLRLLAKDKDPAQHTTKIADSKYLAFSSALVLGWTLVLLMIGSRGQQQADPPQAQLPARPSLRQAVHDWLRDRRNECAATDCPQIPVYLISAEGGGIRAAYWSAQLMSHLSESRDLDLSRRVFSLSGVSGGSLGVTGWRLCMNAPNAPACAASLGAVDLMTPLASAWLFEDILAMVIPTGLCDLPGCGFVDRASWFERSLEKSIVGFEQPFPAAPPYLFLNSTWVETGERAIASNVEIETGQCVVMRQAAVRKGSYEAGWSEKCHPEFPTARDQLFEIGHNARASTLAHNSARFPYFNPIGTVKQGHLADGGYFDNSGTQTTADILFEFARQLTCGGAGCAHADDEPVDAPLATRLTPNDYRKLSKKVAITAIMIRNGVRLTSDPADTNCAVPRAKQSQSLFANAVGPPMAAVNATGIGTPNRVAQCNLQRMLTRLSFILPEQERNGGYVDVRLVSDKTLYPLGWYLSEVAQKGIRDAAKDCVNAQGLAVELARAAEGQGSKRPHPCFERVPSGVPPPASTQRQ